DALTMDNVPTPIPPQPAEQRRLGEKLSKLWPPQEFASGLARVARRTILGPPPAHHESLAIYGGAWKKRELGSATHSHDTIAEFDSEPPAHPHDRAVLCSLGKRRVDRQCQAGHGVPPRGMGC